MVIENGSIQALEQRTFRDLLEQLASRHEIEVVSLRAEANRLRSRLAQLEQRPFRSGPVTRPADRPAEVIDIDNQPLLLGTSSQQCSLLSCENDTPSTAMEIDLDEHVPLQALEAFIMENPYKALEADSEAIDAFMNEIGEDDNASIGRIHASHNSSVTNRSTKSSSRTVHIQPPWIQQPTLDPGVYIGDGPDGERLFDDAPNRGLMSSSTVRTSTQSGPDAKSTGIIDVEVISNARSEHWGEFSEPPNLDPVLKRWRSIVESLQQLASKELYQLSPLWQKHEHVLAKARRTCNQVDLFGQANQKRRNAQNEGGFFSRASRISIAPKGRGSGDDSPKPMLFEDSEGSLGSARSWKLFGFRNFSELERYIVINPASTKRLTWAVLGLFLMIYDLIMVPMEAFELPDDIGLKICQWMAQIYWTLDICFSFITGIYAKGEVEMRLRKIARSYILHWFSIDVIITIPLWFVLVLDLDNSSAEGARSLKGARYVRMLRFLRLARLAKFEHLLNEALEVVNSTSILLCFGIVKLMVIMVILNHVVACIWFLVGTQGENDNFFKGWAKDPKYDDRSVLYQYLSSLHWTLTQFQGTSEITPGTTTLERAYAVTTVLFALIGLASFVSSLTNMMMQLEHLKKGRNLEQRVVRGYLSNHNVSYKLSMRVKAYLSWRQRAQKGREYDEQVSAIIPQQLMMDLHNEVRSPFLTNHTFFGTFQEVYPRTIRMMCFEAVSGVLPSPGELIFSTSDPSKTMYFLINGSLAYKPIYARLLKTAERRQSKQSGGSEDDDEDGPNDNLCDTIQKGEFLSEQALWTQWEHAGDLMVANKDANMLFVDAEAFAKCVQTHPLAIASSILYARRYLAGLNRFGKTYTDYITKEEHDSMMRAADEGLETDSEDDARTSSREKNSVFTTEPLTLQIRKPERNTEEPQASSFYTGFWYTGSGQQQTSFATAVKRSASKLVTPTDPFSKKNSF